MPTEEVLEKIQKRGGQFHEFYRFPKSPSKIGNPHLSFEFTGKEASKMAHSTGLELIEILKARQLFGKEEGHVRVGEQIPAGTFATKGAFITLSGHTEKGHDFIKRMALDILEKQKR